MTLKLLKENKYYIAFIFLFTFLFLFFCSKMSPLYPTNEWVDVNVYQIIGKNIFRGVSLYKDTFDPKGPMIFFIYGIANGIKSDSFIGMFIFQFTIWSFALSCLFLCLNRFITSIVAYIITLFLPFTSLYLLHTGGSPEEFILLFNIILLSCFITPNKLDLTTSQAFILGFCFITIVLLKFNLSVLYIFLVGAYLISKTIAKEYKLVCHFCLYFSLGVILILLPTIVYLLHDDIYKYFWNVYFVLNKRLNEFVSLSSKIDIGWKSLVYDFQNQLISYLLILIGAFITPLIVMKEKYYSYSIVIGAFIALVTCYFAGIFQPYYSLPYFCFIPFGLLLVFRYLPVFIVEKLQRYRYFIAPLFLFVLLGSSIMSKNNFGLTFDQLLRKEKIQGPNYQFAEIISANTDKSTLVLAYGDALNIFALCKMNPNIKYFTSLNINRMVFCDMHDSQVSYLKNKEVAFVIVDELALPLYNDYLNDNYLLIDKWEGVEISPFTQYKKNILLFQKQD